MPKHLEITDSLKMLIAAVIGGFARGEGLPIILISVFCELVMLARRRHTLPRTQ